MYIWRCPVVLQADRTHDVGPIDCWMRSHSLIIWSQFASPRPLVAATIHTERWHHNVPKTAQHPYLYSIFSRLTDICIVTHDSRPHALRRSSTISLHSLQSLGDSVTLQSFVTRPGKLSWLNFKNTFRHSIIRIKRDNSWPTKLLQNIGENLNRIKSENNAQCIIGECYKCLW